MKKINLSEVPAEEWRSPKGKFVQISRGVSLALGRDPKSDRQSERHPFDLEHITIPPGASACPYHAHSAQWELFVFLGGTGRVRTPEGEVPVAAGDVVLHPPGEAHQLTNDGKEDLVLLIVADNPFGEACYYPDSDKWALPSTLSGDVMRGKAVDYLDGEE